MSANGIVGACEPANRLKVTFIDSPRSGEWREGVLNAGAWQKVILNDDKAIMGILCTEKSENETCKLRMTWGIVKKTKQG